MKINWLFWRRATVHVPSMELTMPVSKSSVVNSCDMCLVFGGWPPVTGIGRRWGINRFAARLPPILENIRLHLYCDHFVSEAEMSLFYFFVTSLAVCSVPAWIAPFSRVRNPLISTVWFQYLFNFRDLSPPQCLEEGLPAVPDEVVLCLLLLL